MNSSESALKAIYNPAIMGAVLVTYIVSICALVCCGFHRSVPTNYILLAVFTVCVSYIVGITCLRYDPVIVVEAASLTAAVVVAITVYAITTKTDFTLCGPILFILGFLFATMSLMGFLFGFHQNLFFTVFGVFLFSFYLLVDTQMIIGGKNRTYKISQDDYILASVALYLDIINLFLYILRLLGDR